jgi:two-component system response regulator ResD
MKKLIYVCEDEKVILDTICSFLNANDYEAKGFLTAFECLETFMQKPCDCLITDVNMPNMNGFELVQAIRKQSNVPVIILTARDADLDYAFGIHVGADDYITKPFSPRELIARVKAVLKRTSPDKEKNLVINEGNIHIDTAAREVQISGQIINLTPKEFDLLVYLLKSKGKVLSRERITEQVWDYDYYGDQRTVDTHIKKLRDKLGDDSKVGIKTIWGVGYKVEVTE